MPIVLYCDRQGLLAGCVEWAAYLKYRILYPKERTGGFMVRLKQTLPGPNNPSKAWPPLSLGPFEVCRTQRPSIDFYVCICMHACVHVYVYT